MATGRKSDDTPAPKPSQTRSSNSQLAFFTIFPQGILRHAKIHTTLDLYTQDDDDETRTAQGEYLTALGVATQMVQ